jgi:Fe-S cluster assembly protein SufD
MSYVEHYREVATELPGQELGWLRDLRAGADRAFAERGFPSPREEEWRYTNVTAIEKKRFRPGRPGAEKDVEPLLRYGLADAWRLVLVDGVFSPSLSRLDALPQGVVVLPLSEALVRRPEQVRAWLERSPDGEASRFLDFNTAYFRDGAYIDIAERVALETPIQILNLSTQAEGLSVTRNLIGLGRHAEARIVETHAGLDTAGYLSAAVTQLNLADGASLDHYKLQLESPRAYHFGGLHIEQQAASRLRQHHSAFGGLIGRTDIHNTLGRGAECDLNGLFMVDGRRHLDTHFVVRHREPHAGSREHYRGIAGDRGRGVCAGRIVVDQAAAKTDAEMSSRNLLLSEDAEIDSKPQLEIHTDDVKCSHGVTVGQLDAESVFYLQSRGIDEITARNMLTFAFANEMVEKIALEPLRRQVRQALLCKLPQTGIRVDWL